MVALLAVVLPATAAAQWTIDEAVDPFTDVSTHTAYLQSEENQLAIFYFCTDGVESGHVTLWIGADGDLFAHGRVQIRFDDDPITTERSFNAEAFVFNADYPLQLNVVAKDFKQDDTGLEYIGRSNQQMGDGGLIAQFTDVATGATVAVTNTDWRCLLIPRRAARPRLRGRVRAGARRRPVPVRGYAGAGRLAPARIRRCRMAVRGRAQRSRRQTARRL